MLNLLKADFYRIRKSKLTIIILIIAVALPLFTALLYKGMEVLLELDGEDASIFGFGANQLIKSSFSLSSDIGLILPVFCGIIVCMDITTGTLRNKVICGNKRSNIYFSHLITSIVFNLVVITIYALFNFLFAILLLNYKPEINSDLIMFYLTGILTFAFVASFSSFVALSTKNMALTIILSVAFCIIFGLIISLTSVLIPLSNVKDYVKELMFLLPGYGNSYGQGLDSLEFSLSIISCLLFIAINTTLGILIFNKKDIK